MRILARPKRITIDPAMGEVIDLLFVRGGDGL